MVEAIRLCSTCCKQDVCQYKEETMKTIAEINDICDRKNTLLKAYTSCVAWVSKSENVTKRAVNEKFDRMWKP